MPAYGNFILDKGYDAEAAITIYRAVKGGATAEGVTPCTVLGEMGRGVAQFGVTSGEITRGKGCTCREQGITEWEAGGVIAKDAEVTVAADGRCVAVAGGGTQRIWGYARQAASGAGVRIAVELAIVKPIKV